MATSEIIFGELGGGGSVKSGTVNLTQNGTEQIDTGLSSVTRFVIFGLNTSAVYPPGVNFSWWFSDYPTWAGTNYSDGYSNGRSLGNGQNTLTQAMGTFGIKVTDVTDGIVTVKGSPNNVEGTYYWYAE